MKRSIINEYRIFTSPIYRIVVWLLLPLGNAGLAYALRRELDVLAGKNIDFTMSFETGLILMIICLPVFIFTFVDPLADIFFMKMYERKKLGCMKYLHGSSYGNHFMKSAIIGDMVRRILTVVVVLSVVYFGFLDTCGLGMDWFVSMNLIFVALISISVLVSRYGDSFVTSMIFDMFVVYGSFAGLAYLMSLDKTFWYVADGVSILLLVLYFYDFHKKLERSYFDE